MKVLLAQNTFHLQAGTFPRFKILSHLRDALPPDCFAGIRSLEISFLHGIHYREQKLDREWFCAWDEIWHNVKLIKSLVDLQVWLNLEQEVIAEQEARLFEPLMGLKIRNFKFEVTWPANEGLGPLLLGAPFDLVRNNDPVPGKPEFGTEVVN